MMNETECINFYGTTETPQAMGHFVVPAKAALNGHYNQMKPVIPLGKGIDGGALPADPQLSGHLEGPERGGL